jgi:AraC family transcriptional regulator of adaptative response/methylated-DNA-[protein]-cysteine methyltransferase
MIAFGDTPQYLHQALQERFMHAWLESANDACERWTAATVAFVEDPTRGLSLPLEIHGTVFQKRVWQVLQTIPIATTITYSKLAHLIDAPTAVRAVARACANNPIALAIPCHRVIRTDGSMAGYRWGIARKRELLARENQNHECLQI